MILEVARGHIVLKTEQGVVRILGEALLPGYGSPDFVVYKNSIKEWLDPEGVAIDSKAVDIIIQQLIFDANEKNLKIEIE